APFIGRESLLEEALQIVQQSIKGRRVLLIEGIPGIGKSRFLEELQIHCAFQGFTFVKLDCRRTEEVQHYRIFESLKNSVSSDWNELGSLDHLSNSSQGSHSVAEFKEYYQDETSVSDLIASLTDVARK